MRGDRPEDLVVKGTHKEFTPHARGSTPHIIPPTIIRSVYPACAGIDLSARPAKGTTNRLPRMRGDRPEPCLSGMHTTPFTPHARGSTLGVRFRVPLHEVYPACAGIDLLADRARGPVSGLPRMRGDRPLFFASFESRQWFTPHARGSTQS